MLDRIRETDQLTAASPNEASVAVSSLRPRQLRGLTRRSWKALLSLDIVLDRRELGH